jgi:hypothetical protein
MQDTKINETNETKESFEDQFLKHLEEFVNALNDFMNAAKVDNETRTAALAMSFYSSMLVSGMRPENAVMYLDEMRAKYEGDFNKMMKEFPEPVVKD